MTEKKSMLDGEKQYHIGLAPGDVADFVILPGDPGRVEFIAGHFDEAKEVAFNREYKTCLLYTSPSPRDLSTSRMPSSA